jgi:hypothetical protein
VLIYGWHSNTDDYAGVRGIGERDRSAFYFDQNVPEKGKVVELESVRDADEPIGDFPNTGLAYPKCLSERAYSALQSLLEPTGTVRYADLDGGQFYLYWPRIVSDCLDYGESEIVKMPSGYEQLLTPVFRQDVADAGPIFLVAEFRTQVLFVTESFRDCARKADLKGLELRQGGGAGALATQIG